MDRVLQLLSKIILFTSFRSLGITLPSFHRNGLSFWINLLLAPTEQIPSTFIFTNCNNLEQAAKYSISSYAQRRSQLDALKCHDGGVVSKSLFRSSFPGCEIPSWFSHQAVGSVLEPKLPPHWCDGRLTAVALCAVVSFQQPRNQVNRISVECNCKFKNEDGSCIVFRSTLGGWIQPPGEGLEMESDHIFMGHTCCLNIGTSLREKHSRKCVPTEAVIEFNVVRDDGTSEVEGCQVVNCGLSLVYAEPNNVSCEQNPNGSSRRDVVSEENNRPRWGYGFSFLGL
ncbi:PREDICTED: inactive disease resistance protein RPS4-like [Tarenaya hassleriana]|uniref:inactive disease resistance protein RPS4-like n=1 Tax=Tarenaya hassleriana TaxID=28532 RepID=UPI00053C2CD4|nr:PREDICTED: inactive disease resistance protein RPS4-like [Tarenaya hassleriana]